MSLLDSKIGRKLTAFWCEKTTFLGNMAPHTYVRSVANSWIVFAAVRNQKTNRRFYMTDFIKWSTSRIVPQFSRHIFALQLRYTSFTQNGKTDLKRVMTCRNRGHGGLKKRRKSILRSDIIKSNFAHKLKSSLGLQTDFTRPGKTLQCGDFCLVTNVDMFLTQVI